MNGEIGIVGRLRGACVDREVPIRCGEEAEACGCPKLCRAWSRCVPVLVDEPVASARSTYLTLLVG
jgi:hypothetical protein